jgi:hypothetical protein
MKLRMLLALVVSFGIVNASETTNSSVRIPKSAILGKSALGKARLMRDEEGFKVVRKGKSFPVDPTLVEAPLRTMNDQQLGKYLTVAKIAVSKTSDKNFALRTHVPGNGGGLGGATAGFYIGKFLTHFVAHGTIAVVSLLTGPAALVTAASLEATFLPLIEGTSNVVALGTGIIGGVVTGPV